VVTTGYRVHKSSDDAIGSLPLGLYTDDGLREHVPIDLPHPGQHQPPVSGAPEKNTPDSDKAEGASVDYYVDLLAAFCRVSCTFALARAFSASASLPAASS
jgi:hypothetical protein